MSDILQSVLGFGIASGFYLAVLFGALIWFAAVVIAPKQLVILIVVLTAAFPPGSSLVAGNGFGFDPYNKGASYFFFSMLEISLLLLAVAAALRRAGAGHNPLAKYYWMMFVVLLWHIMITLIEGKLPWIANLSRAGIFYLLLQGLFVHALASYVATREDLNRLMGLLALAISLRMIWGGFRYVFLGGDPMNFYDDMTEGGGHLRMTFWDINDSIYACLLGGLLLWIAAVADERPRWQRAAVLLFGLYCFVIVALSARRTAQGGALLALLVLLVMLPKGRRWPVLLVFALSVPMAMYKLQERMGTGESLVDQLTQQRERSKFYVDPRMNRFYELHTAWKTIEEHPLIGVGPAGEFEVTDDTGLAYHKGNFGFVHSGFVHVLLKTGAIGLAIFCLLLLGYVRALVRTWSGTTSWHRGVLAASACGFAASIPNLAVGTPQIEARTMLVMGVLFALPLLVARTLSQIGTAQDQAPIESVGGLSAPAAATR